MIDSNNLNAKMISLSALAQLVEQMTVNHWVAGSSPAGGAKYLRVMGSSGPTVILRLRLTLQFIDYNSYTFTPIRTSYIKKSFNLSTI